MSVISREKIINFIKSERYPLYINTVKADVDDANLLCQHIYRGFEMKFKGMVVDNQTALCVETEY